MMVRLLQYFAAGMILPALLSGQPVTSTALPVRFEPNVGQAGPDIDFLARGPRQSILLNRNEARIDLYGTGSDARMARLRIEWLDARDGPAPRPSDPLESVSHYYLGADQSRWFQNVPNYGRVLFPEVYSGVDLIYYGNAGRVEYDFVVAPQSDASQIRFRIHGAAVTLDSSGGLVADTPAGAFRLRTPISYQRNGMQRTAVRSRYAVDPDGAIRFELGAYDRSREVVIDPVLMFSTLLGGVDADVGGRIALDSSGSVYIGGTTYSRNFPTAGIDEPNFSRNLQGLYDGYVAKLRADGTSLIYSTYIGGDQLDIINAIAVDSRGAAYVSGQTASFNFPLPATAYSRSRRGFSDAFVLKLNPNGTLGYATLLGGRDDENGIDILVDSASNVYLTGYTSSPDFPTTANAAQRNFGGGNSDGFALKLDPAGQILEFSTYIGGLGEEETTRLPASDLPQIAGVGSFRIALDAKGAVWLAGSTSTADLGVTAETAGRTYGGGATDVYLYRLSPDGSRFEFMTYIGGSGADVLNALALDGAGNPVVAGTTLSRNFPTTPNAMYPAFLGGDSDAFVARIRTDNGAVDYATHFGGQGEESIFDLTAASNGDVYFVGYSNSRNFPSTADAADPGPPRTFQPFLAAINRTGNTRLTAGFFGGPDAYAFNSVALDGDSNIVVSGRARGAGFTTTVNAYDPTYNGGAYDVFITKFAKVTGGSGGGGPATGVCSFTLDPGLLDLPGDPLVATVTVLTGPECPWTVSSSLSWAAIVGGRDRRGPGVVYVSVSVNTEGPRAGTLLVAGRDVVIRQARRTSAPGAALTPIARTLAGAGQPGAGGDDGPASRAQFTALGGIAVDTRGSLFLSDPETHVIRRVRPDGVIVAFAGIGTNGFTGDGGPASRARLNQPEGLALDSAGNLYVADRANRRIRRIAADGTISTFAGNGQSGSEGDGGQAREASFREPAQLVFDTAGNLYVADRAANRIRRITPAGIISTFAGTGQPGFDGDGGQAASARITNPAGMTFDRQGNFYFADQFNHRLRRINSRGVIETVAGTGIAAWEGDNRPASTAAFNSPFGLAFDNQSNLYVTDRDNHRIRVIDSRGVISNFAGSGVGTFFGEEVPARNSVWRFPEALVADAAGNLIVADTGNLRVRRIDFPLPPPPATAIRAVLNTFSAEAVISGFSLATIFGENFVAEPLTWDTALAEGRLPFELGGVRVSVNNRAAAISYVGPGQINIVVPLDLTSGPVPVEVTGPNGRGNATAFMADVSPALLTRKIGEHTSPYAQFAGEAVQVAPPGAIPDVETRLAREGDLLDLIATGLGLTDPVPPEGVTFASPFPLADLSRLAVTIGGKNAPVEAALMVAPGTYLVRIRIPEAPGSGEQPIRLEVRGVAAQPGLTLPLE